MKNEWTCHVCGNLRPDASISVYKKEMVYNGARIGQHNVRYCNDRPVCINQAPTISLLPKEGAIKLRETTHEAL